MQDTELYRHLLAIESPWVVTRVELQVKEQRVDVWVGHAKGEHWQCPECGNTLPTYDHAPERTWRHRDSCQFMTYLHARIPRVKCPEHGVKQARVPWAGPRANFTQMFEVFAIVVFMQTDVLGGTRILRITWDEGWGVMERAVARGLAAKGKRVVPLLGVDEKSAAKGHKYITLVYDLKNATVEYIGDERTTETLDAYFVTLSPEQIAGIEAIAMDMWQPYINSTRAHVPEADSKIVFDRFHIMKHMLTGVDNVRKQEHRELQAQGDDTLLRSKYLWLYSEENLPDKHVDRFEELRAAELKTGRASSIKETLRHLWDHQTVEEAEPYWKKWYFWATHSQLPPIVKAAKTIHRHIDNVMTYFSHRITNAVAEGVNNKIQTIKKRSYGFRNRENFKTAIYFHCGGLALYPSC